MAETIEFVFEGVPRAHVAHLFIQLLGNAEEVVSVQCTENRESETGDIVEILRTAIASPFDLSVMVRVRKLRIGDTELPDALIRMVKYDGSFDVDCSFDSDFMCGRVAYLQTYLCQIADEFGVPSYFAGMDPAVDPETRFFSNRETGPLECRLVPNA
jgi:hypothetical protein